MKKRLERMDKAYANIDFLKSPSARSIRILSEYLEPYQSLKKEKVTDTVVFFGSARTVPPDIAKKELNELEEKAVQLKGDIPQELRDAIANAKITVSMSRYYDEAVELSRRITEWAMTVNSGYRFVVCSGGGPGIMEAANRGADLAGGKSVGLNISIPMEQDPNPYITEELNFEFHYFFMRKFWFIYLAKALVIFPGGFGTMDELFEVLTLVQTEKVTKPLPIVIYGREFWNKLVNFEAMVEYGVISKNDLKLFRFYDDVEEAFEYLKSQLTEQYLKPSKSIQVK